MRKRKTPAGHMADKLYVLPFLLVCVLFVWFGAETLPPGMFRRVWVFLASGITLYAWIALLRKPILAWKPSARMVEGTETARRKEGESGSPGGEGEDIAEYALMAEVDRILGLEGVLEAKLEADAEQRERLEELKALYELRSISEEEYERKFREILEEKR